MVIPRAFIFDLNGTMIDDMQFHIKGWFHLLNDELGAHISMEEVKAQMYGKNSEVLTRIFGKGHFTEEKMNELSINKEKEYQKVYRPSLKLIDGLPEFLESASNHHIAMAIGSAAIPFNIDFVLDNLNIRHYFSAIVSADDVVHSKPDPETYLKAASLLGIPPQECIVFEDAPKGVEAAANAGMDAVVITTVHAKEEFSQYSNVLACLKDFRDPWLNQFFQGRS